jgi:hypothetical protein
MSTNRKATQEYILKWISKLTPGNGDNTKIYTDLFNSMDDKAFDVFMQAIGKEDIRLAIIAPNFGTTGISTENNLKIATEIGHEFFQRIWIEGEEEDTPTYLTPVPYLVVDLPLRRQAQLAVKKLSVPEDSRSIDDLTGQATGKSKGSKLSYPEIQVMAAMNLTNCLNETIKFRGGDAQGFSAMNSAITQHGGVSLKSIEHLASGVESTKSLKSLLTAMHLKTTGL